MVKTFVIRCLLCLSGSVFVSSALAALPEGVAAPAFKTQAALAGKTLTYDLEEALNKGPVVIYFYPSAFTNGCNIQAHEFAVQHERFVKAGASIIGVSLDSLDRLKAFSADPEFCAGKITVASDVAGHIAKAYDISVRETTESRKDTRGATIDHGLAERTTFVVDKAGVIVAVIGGVSPAENVAQALKTVQELADIARKP